MITEPASVGHRQLVETDQILALGSDLQQGVDERQLVGGYVSAEQHDCPPKGVEGGVFGRETVNR